MYNGDKAVLGISHETATEYGVKGENNNFTPKKAWLHFQITSYLVADEWRELQIS